MKSKLMNLNWHSLAFMEELLLLPKPPLFPLPSFSLLLQTTELPFPRLLSEDTLMVESILDAADISFSRANRCSDIPAGETLFEETGTNFSWNFEFIRTVSVYFFLSFSAAART